MWAKINGVPAYHIYIYSFNNKFKINMKLMGNERGGKGQIVEKKKLNV